MFPKKEERSEDSKHIIRLKDKESVVGVFRGELREYYQHWFGPGTAPAICADRRTCEHCKAKVKSSYRFRANIAVPAQAGGYEMKIFEGGRTIYDQLAEIATVYDVKQHAVKLSRSGSGLNDTTYSVMPLPTGAVTGEKLAAIEKLPLHDLAGGAEDDVPMPQQADGF